MKDEVRCPACDSARVVVVIYPRPHARCMHCEAVWHQEGTQQVDVLPGKEELRRVPAG